MIKLTQHRIIATLGKHSIFKRYFLQHKNICELNRCNSKNIPINTRVLVHNRYPFILTSQKFISSVVTQYTKHAPYSISRNGFPFSPANCGVANSSLPLLQRREKSGSVVTMSSQLTVVNSERAPKALGPYSHSVKHAGVVYASGQIGNDPQTGKLVGDLVTDQAEQALKNLQNVLESSGSSFENVIKTTVFLVDMKDFPSINSVYVQFFGESGPSNGHKPARSCVEVAALPFGAKFEIEAIAAVIDAETRISGGDERNAI